MARGFDVARGLVALALLAGCGVGAGERLPVGEAAPQGARSPLVTLNPNQQLPQVSPTASQAVTGEAARCAGPNATGSAELDGELAFKPDTVTARLLEGCAQGVRCAMKIFMVRYPSELGTEEFLNVFVGSSPNDAIAPGHYAVPFGLPDAPEGPRSDVDYTYVPRVQDPSHEGPTGIDHRKAMSGSVDIASVTASGITGSFDVTFGFNGTRRLRGTFCAPIVPNLR